MEAAVLRELQPLQDATVIATMAEGSSDFPGEVFPVLVFKCADGKTRSLCVDRDPEGNGPGFARIEVIS